VTMVQERVAALREKTLLVQRIEEAKEDHDRLVAQVQ